MAEKPSPPRALEAVVELLIPPVYREHVLGDLRERYISPMRYLADATWSVPCVIASRVRRTTDPMILATEACAIYLAFFAASWGRGEIGFLQHGMGAWLLWIPTLIAVGVLKLADAYADPRKRTPVKPLLFAALAVGVAVSTQALLGMGDVELLVPGPVLTWGGAAGVLVISAFRALSPPPGGPPRAAS